MTRKRRLRDSVIANLLVPLMIGFVLGWMQPGRTAAWPLPTTMLYWLLAVELSWLIVTVLTHAARIVLKPWEPKLWQVLVGGYLLAIPAVYQFMKLLIATVQNLMLVPMLHAPLPRLTLESVFNDNLVGLFLWVSINLMFVELLDISRFGYVRVGSESGERSSPTSHKPSFLDRLDRPVGAIWALEAEQHYLRVIGADGSDLILYRISDAIREIEAWTVGAQVHRSYWIAKAGIAAIDRADRRLHLVLKNGMRVPVSRSYRRGVAAAGLLSSLAESPSSEPFVQHERDSCEVRRR